MIKSFVLTTGLALAIVQLALISGGSQVVVVQAAGPFKNFKELHAATLELNSAQLVLENKEEKFNTRRAKLLERFAREIKSNKCNEYLTGIKRLETEFKEKAGDYISDCESGKNNWLMNVFSGGPAGGMKNLAKNEPQLLEVARRYEAQGEDRKLNIIDLECDMLKFRIRSLEAIFVVLSTDVRYLITEDPQVLNRNILAQLKQDKLTAPYNFNKIKLSNKQKKLLFEYLAYHKDLTAITVEQALEHFNTPSDLVVDRLMDSCRAIMEQEMNWAQLEEDRAQVCLYSKSDPNNETFSDQVNVNKFRHTIEFCQRFSNITSL